MRRRVLALVVLTSLTVVTGSIASADGPDVDDLAAAALGTTPTPVAPEATDVEALDLDPSDLSTTRRRDARAPQVAQRAELLAEEPGRAVKASWYGPGFHGRRTANGEVYDQWGLTAAHKTLPFGTELRVTNTANGRSVIVRINDRGPFIPGREIDLSRGAAEAIGMTGVGTVLIHEL